LWLLYWRLLGDRERAISTSKFPQLQWCETHTTTTTTTTRGKCAVIQPYSRLARSEFKNYYTTIFQTGSFRV
jgi:hypothetical protein